MSVARRRKMRAVLVVLAAALLSAVGNASDVTSVKSGGNVTDGERSSESIVSDTYPPAPDASLASSRNSALIPRNPPYVPATARDFVDLISDLALLIFVGIPIFFIAVTSTTFLIPILGIAPLMASGKKRRRKRAELVTNADAALLQALADATFIYEAL